MTDKPILFSAPMIRALMDGRKTQTRRALKPQPRSAPIRTLHGEWTDHKKLLAGLSREDVQPLKGLHAAGDRLWVRETFQLPAILNTTPPRKVSCMSPIIYTATEDRDNGEDGDGNTIKDRPSIFMPRWASRLTLTVTDVRVQRLQDISAEDAIAEGIVLKWNGDDIVPDPASFRDLWNSINGPDAWDENPWVAAYSFDVHRGNIDQMEAS